ncbi:MAG: hypothetical protein HYW33_00515 [Candidatus Blackburnbacteria bacterium]|nr:hypothetical protein [Candidatus Blackburnbacteria bacterium]
MASWLGTACVGTKISDTVDASDVATIAGLECAFGNVIGVVLALSGVVVFVTFLIGGFKYLTSGSDPKAVESAKHTLTAAIAGLVVLVLAFAVLLVIQAVTGVQVTQFKVTTP